MRTFFCYKLSFCYVRVILRHLKLLKEYILFHVLKLKSDGDINIESVKMKINILSIPNSKKDFAFVTFDIHYHLNGEEMHEKNLKLDHKKYKKLIDNGEIHIPDDHDYNSFQEMLDEYFDEKNNS